MTKKGEFRMETPTEFQCKQRGQKRFTYAVTVTCGCKLDQYGFLIDNALVHQYTQECIVSTSCERICMHIANVLTKKLRSHGAVLKSIRVEVVPKIRKPTTTMVYEETF